MFTGENCSAGWAVVNPRPSFDTSHNLTIVARSKVVSCYGEVIQWRYRALKDRLFRAIIWRQVPGSDTEFQIVGINDITKTAGSRGEIIFHVPSRDRIAVKPGDVIGWSSVNGSLTMKGSDEDDNLLHYRKYNTNILQINQTFDIKHSSSFKREYSIKAVVQETKTGGNVAGNVTDRVP